MRAFGYIRVSTGQQAKKYSLDAQQEEIERYCAENGIEVLAGFEEDNSVKKSKSGNCPLSMSFFTRLAYKITSISLAP